jgi:hypothetical protein
MTFHFEPAALAERIRAHGGLLTLRNQPYVVG